MENEQIVYLSPDQVIPGENIRFSLRKERVEKLAEEIKESGFIHTPLWVDPPTADGYPLVAGNYRHAAAQLLNQSGAGVNLPCIVRDSGDALSRLKLQLSENKDREGLSILDTSNAMKKLMESGASRLDVRTLFSRPSKRKGGKVEPLSNSMLNIYLSFLDFPKAIQNRLHDGTVPIFTAYQLSRYPRAKWEEILKRVDEARATEVEQEEKDEKKFAEDERKSQELQDKADADATALEAARKAIEAAEAEQAAQAELAAEAYKAAKAKTDDEAAKAAAKAALEAAEAATAAAEKQLAAAQKQADKLEIKVGKNTQAIAERAKKLKALQKSKAATKKVTPEEVKKAGAAVGATPRGGLAPLKAPDMREVVRELTLGGNFPKVQAIGLAFVECFNSVGTTNDLKKKLAVITGEAAEKPASKKAKAVVD